MQRRNFKERPDVIEELSNLELIERYRFDRAGLVYLEQELEYVLRAKTNRNHSLSAMQKLLVTLRYLATGSIQLNYADIHGVSQPTVSRVIAEVTDAISRPQFSGLYIHFPNTVENITAINREFYGVARFPNVLGVVDGTHIQIQAPTVDEESYVNRMSYHSINTQIVFDANYTILDLVARWPGSTHDSRILRESGLWALLDGGHLHAGTQYLLGDSGYPCKRWLLTPYLHPQPGSQTGYNKAHKHTRSIVERGIGQLKRRWGVLQGQVRLKPEKACKVIIACGVLHNICKRRNIPFIQDIDDANAPNIPPAGFHGPQEGLRFRDYIANTHF